MCMYTHLVIYAHTHTHTCVHAHTQAHPFTAHTIIHSYTHNFVYAYASVFFISLQEREAEYERFGKERKYRCKEEFRNLLRETKCITYR